MAMVIALGLRCRNGARPWRTGRLVMMAPMPPARAWPQWSPSLADGTTSWDEHQKVSHPRPQWSPSLADGTTSASIASRAGVPAAAMEPVLGGRDDDLRQLTA